MTKLEETPENRPTGMPEEGLTEILQAITDDPANRQMKTAGYPPLYTAAIHSKIVIIGQAPGRRAQESGIPWNDASGIKLRSWLGVDDTQFYNPESIALLPMDFYYPGRSLHGDLPPRKDFAPKWHPRILACMPDVRLIILIGGYAQKYYLGATAKPNLTLTVQSYRDYLPQYFPLVHPSPLNFRWQSKNPWFESDLVPVLRKTVAKSSI
jgi:uracil-DNA glycosylase